jgi:hypothetical protein
MGLLLVSAAAWPVDYFVLKLGVGPVSAVPPGWQPTAGETVRLHCEWTGKQTSDQNSKFDSDMKGQILIDGKPQGIPAAGFSSSSPIHTSADWIATGGKHRVGCKADSLDHVKETNESNNYKEMEFTVFSAGPRTVVSGTSALATARLPGTNDRGCKAKVSTTVQLDKSQFALPGGVPDSNAVKLSLDLYASQAVGNYVHCQYRSAGKDVQMVNTYDCANATRKAGKQHDYSCD